MAFSHEKDEFYIELWLIFRFWDFVWILKQNQTGKFSTVNNHIHGENIYI
jgi:hypothetical protein